MNHNKTKYFSLFMAASLMMSSVAFALPVRAAEESQKVSEALQSLSEEAGAAQSAAEAIKEIPDSAKAAEDMQSTDEENAPVSAGETRSTLETQNQKREQTETKKNTVSYERQMILIGDSRTVHMHEAVGDDGQIWSCRGNIGLVWMKAVGVPAVERYISSDTNVVILMGVNDAWQQTTDAMTTAYADYLNSKAKQWIQKGANVFFVSVNPVESEWGNSALTITNESIDLFNSELRAKLQTGVHYIDVSSRIRTETGFTDPLHFDEETNRKIYSLVKETCEKYQTETKKEDRVSGNFSNYFYTSNKEEQKTASREMYRLYNPNSGEHFYTGSAGERDHLKELGWQDEGTGWKAPVTSETPVYRLYNPNSGLHHYTISKGERDSLVRMGWSDEGIGWYSDDCRRNLVYREYNPNTGQHNYTSARQEHAYLISAGWQDESCGWFSM